MSEGGFIAKWKDDSRFEERDGSNTVTHRPGKYDRTLQVISAVDCNSSPVGSSILTENVVVGYGNLQIFGGLPKPGFRHGKDQSVLKQ